MKKIINTTNAPAPIGPYSQAILTGNMLYTSGQIPLDPKTGELVMENITKETTQVMENLKAVLTEAGMTFENVLKLLFLLLTWMILVQLTKYMVLILMLQQHLHVKQYK